MLVNALINYEQYIFYSKFVTIKVQLCIVSLC